MSTLREAGEPMDAGAIASRLRVKVSAVRTSFGRFPIPEVQTEQHPELGTLVYRLREWGE